MKFRDNAKQVFSSDLWYDLIDGGRINPDDLLEKEDADRVREAIKTVVEFMDTALELGLIEVG
ncbi:hypothetical protein DRN85_10295 [Methanosarcinales archaeon]|nr:MAG: hypothetical protein DRN85_10295 [Methanosarcinales archaeon]